MSRVPALILVLLALAVGCAKPSGRAVEVHGPDGGRYYATVFHFLTAANDHERAEYVHDGEALREEMGRYFASRPLVSQVHVVDVEALSDAAVVTARVRYADGSEGRVKVVVRKGDPAWLVDWQATRALWE
jgi:hypothetical protein